MEISPSPCGRTSGRMGRGLVTCPDCNREVSYRAPHCVHCGRPNPGGSCKGALVAVHVAIVLTIGLAAFMCLKKEHHGAWPVSCRTSVLPACGHVGDWDAAMSGRPSGTGFLGIQLDDSGDGAVVTLVGTHSPAARIGLHVGDRIIRIDGGSTGCHHDVLDAIWRRKPGEPLEVAVRRDGAMRIFDVTLEKHPRD